MNMMTEYDVKTLRAIAGDDVSDFIWGAGATVCLEWLLKKGLVVYYLRKGTVQQFVYDVTEHGVQFLEWSEANGWSHNYNKFLKDIKDDEI